MIPKGVIEAKGGLGLALLSSTVAACVAGALSDRLQWMALAPIPLLILLSLKDVRHLYHILLFSIPFSSEVDVTSTLGTDFPDEPLMWLLSGLLILVAMARHERIVASVGSLEPRTAAFLLLHLAWVFIATVLSSYPLLSVKYAAAKLWYVTALGFGSWYCLRSMEDIRKAAAVLGSSTLLALILVTAKHIGLGLGFDTVNRSVEPFFRNHVNYGALLACLAPLPVAGFVLFPKRRGLFTVVAILWAVALFFSYSRGAWLAVAAGAATVVAIRYRLLWLLAVACSVGVMATLLYLRQDNRYLDFSPHYERTVYHPDLADHLQATYRMTDISTMERFHRWIAAFRMMDGHLLHGYGPNSFYHEYRSRTVSAFRTYVSDNPEKSTVHNYFLLLLVEQGLPGMLLFLMLTMSMLNAAHTWYHGASEREERVVALVVSAVIAAVVVLNMLSDLIESDKVGTVFFICLGILLRFPPRVKSKPGV